MTVLIDRLIGLVRPHQKSFQQLTFGLSCLLGAWGLFWFVWSSYHKIMYPYALNLGEPALAQTIEMMRVGIMPYRDLNTAPFSLTPYGPVYLILSVVFKSFLSGHFIAGRTIAFLSTLMLGLIVGYFAFKRAKSFAVSSLFFGAFVVTPIIQRWGVQVNVDVTALCLEALAFCLFLKHIKQPNRKLLIFAILVQALAFYTKSSAITAGASFALWSLSRKEFRTFFVYAVTQAGCLLAIMLFMNFVTEGRYYFQTVFEIGHRLFFWKFIPLFWSEFVTTNQFLIVAIFVAGVVMIRKKEWSIQFIALIVSSGLTFSLGKQGSDTNYLLSFIMYGLIFSARHIPNHKVLRILYCIPVCAHLLAFMPMNTDFVRSSQEHAEMSEFYGRFSKMIQNTTGPIISWDMSLLLANEKPIYFEPFPMAQMAYSGVWDEKPILDAIENKTVSLMILYFLAPVLKGDRNFTPGFINALNQNYKMIGQTKTPWSGTPYWFFYVPKEN